MDGSKSREALLAFLSYLSDKGLMHSNTAQARKSAAAKILGILDTDEAKDITLIDLDHVVDRFSRLHGKDYTPASLAAYRSRLKSAVDDFNSYLANPLGFRVSTPMRVKPATKSLKDIASAEAPAPQELRAEPAKSSPVVLPSDKVLPIPIRADLTIYVQGLPFDLTEAEARKIANVITAMAG